MLALLEKVEMTPLGVYEVSRSIRSLFRDPGLLHPSRFVTSKL